MKFHRTAPWQDNDPLRSELNHDQDMSWTNPDGLRPWDINALITAVHKEWRDQSAPTSALLDGSAEGVRLARMERRAVANRSLMKVVPAARPVRTADAA